VLNKEFKATRYRTLKDYLLERFGARVQRVTLEGGFTCPNRDGTKASGGCSFCTDDGSSSGAQTASDSIRVQLEEGIAKQSKRFNIDKFIAYFQSFTNTYAEINYLRELYDQAVLHPQVVVLAIGTRPD
jgi:radical SAM protein (TIGR01212 family)